MTPPARGTPPRRNSVRALALIAAVVALPAAANRLAGHGGPVMDVAVADGRALTASFDNSAGFWPELDGTAPTWLDGHAAAVNTVAFLPGGRAASGADDFAVIVWDLATGRPLHRLEGHRGKVSDVAPAPNGNTLASAGWDGTVRLWDTETGRSLAVLEGHDGPVNAVAFGADGRLYSASADGTVLEWDLASGQPARTLVRHGFGVNRLAMGAGWLAYGAADGGTRAVDLATGEVLADLTADRRPILALALAPDGSRLAVGDGEGHVMVVSLPEWRVERDFRAALNGPIWALAFADGGGTLIAGGISDDAAIFPLDAPAEPRARAPRRFHADPATLGNGERQFLRKCSVCHTLTPDGDRRAGPTLHGLFGRAAGSVADYAYSPALAQSDIVWTAETVDDLFELGPDHVTPGSKMPMQRIAEPQDRADLIAFLRRETMPETTE